MDQRVKRLAHLLINYSLKLKKGQLLKIQGEAVAMPLIEAAFEEALKVGANPYIQLNSPETEEIFFKNASKAQLEFVSPIRKLEVNKIDSFLGVWASTNTKYLSGVESKKQSMASKARYKLMMKFFKRVADKSLTWVGTQFPTHADAQDAEMSLKEYEDFVYKAGHVHKPDPIKHWKKVHKEQQRLVKILNRFDRIHVQSPHADLKLRVKGRKWINCDGTENFPDGEIFTSPIENTVEGFIRYTYPAVYQGKEVDDVRFEFKKGKVVNETAAKNLKFLQEMLNIDKGGRFVGEFAIGTNYEIKQFSKNTLFDEKIGGTCHLAVGASIPESGGKNKSAIHWDMVCDLKKNSEITADGKLIYKNGKFVI
jgi:aminopeptidase